MRSILLTTMMLVFCATTSLAGDGQTASDSAMAELLHKTVTIDCRAYQAKAASRAMEYYDAGERDSLRLVVDFIVRLCDSYGFAKLDTLLAIEDGEEFDDWCDTVFVAGMPWDVFGYGGVDVVFAQDKYTDIQTKFRLFMFKVAEGLLPVVRQGSMAEAIVKVYLDQRKDLALKLSKSEYSGYCIQEYYDARVAGILSSQYKNRVHAAVNLGVWTPLRASNALHTKIEFGGQFGFRHNRIGFDATALLRVLKEPSDYQVERKGVLESTSSFIGGLVGVDFTYEAIRFNRSRFELFAGVAYDGFQAIDDGDNGKSISSFNANVGGSLRFFYNKKRTQFFGLQVRHSFVRYRGGGSDLSGNALSINLIYGIMINQFVMRRLDNMKYFSGE